MSDTKVSSGPFKDANRASRAAWAWHPPLPIKVVPVFVWPPRPLAALRYLLSRAFLASVMLPFATLSTVTWLWLQPALERCAVLGLDWILQMYARNLGLMLFVAGGLQLFFYTFRRQGTERKFDPRPLNATPQRFFARNQVVDNVLWTCTSGVAVWTAYEVGFMWAYANGLVPFYLDPVAHPFWFVLGFVTVPFIAATHFYFVHRLLHWRPVYRRVHALHHRNDNLGPWSGLSMHPVEHVIYLSSVLVHAVLLSHPIHVLFHMQWNTLGSAVTHTGFESLTFRRRPLLMLGSFHHQLHHRFYDCNYGTPFMPCDRWFGTEHDGTPEAMEAVKRRRRTKLAGGCR